MREIGTALKVVLAMTLITGIFYPLFLTMAAQLFFPYKANGSFLYKHGRPIGSELIAQKFQNPGYFWPRPSAIDYNPYPSGGSNLSPTSSKLKKLFNQRMLELKKQHEGDQTEIPSNLLFASGSGVDPHISLKAAYYQINRIAKTRNVDKTILKQLVDRNIQNKLLGVFGLTRVNVLKLNIELDQQFSPMEHP